MSLLRGKRLVEIELMQTKNESVFSSMDNIPPKDVTYVKGNTTKTVTIPKHSLRRSLHLMYFWYTLPQFEALENSQIMTNIDPKKAKRYIYSEFKKGKNVFFHNQLIRPVWKKTLNFDGQFPVQMDQTSSR